MLQRVADSDGDGLTGSIWRLLLPAHDHIEVGFAGVDWQGEQSRPEYAGPFVNEVDPRPAGGAQTRRLADIQHLELEKYP